MGKKLYPTDTLKQAQSILSAWELIDPSLKIGSLLETHKHGINDILLESLEAEKAGLVLYRQLLELVRDRSVLLEDYARRMIAEEELHVGEVNKMLRKPGDITQFQT